MTVGKPKRTTAEMVTHAIETMDKIRAAGFRVNYLFENHEGGWNCNLRNAENILDGEVGSADDLGYALENAYERMLKRNAKAGRAKQKHEPAEQQPDPFA